MLTKELQFVKHSAVIGAFNKEFVHSGIFEGKYYKALSKGFDYRLQGDYGMIPVPEDAAKAVLIEAKDFVSKIEGYLKENGFIE